MFAYGRCLLGEDGAPWALIRINSTTWPGGGSDDDDDDDDDDDEKRSFP